MCGQVEILPTVNHNSLSLPCTSCILPSTTVLTHRTPQRSLYSDRGTAICPVDGADDGTVAVLLLPIFQFASSGGGGGWQAAGGGEPLESARHLRFGLDLPFA